MNEEDFEIDYAKIAREAKINYNTIYPEKKAPEQPSGWHIFAYSAFAVVALCAAAVVLWVIAVGILTLRDKVMAWWRERCDAARVALPEVARKCATPEAMCALFAVAVVALVLIALCVVVIACVLVF